MNSEANLAAGQARSVEKVGDAWVVPGVGSFMNQAVYSFKGNTFPDGLRKSNYTIYSSEATEPHRIPHNIRYDPANVRCQKGYLNLTVPGAQNPNSSSDNAVNCAEVATVEDDILYASVRTRAIFSKEPGTCHGWNPDSKWF